MIRRSEVSAQIREPSYVDAVRISLLEKFRENHSYVSVIFLKVTLKVR